MWRMKRRGEISLIIHPSSFFIFILFACNKNELHTYYQYTSFIERTTQQRPSSSFLISMALCSRVVVESSSSSMMMRRGAAFNNNHSNKKKIFLSFLLTKRRITRFSGLTNSGSSSFEQRGGGGEEEEENNKDKKDELVIITNDALHYASTMTQKRNEVEEYLQKCDSLELELQLALAAEDYDAASKIKKNLQPENSDEDINFSMLCDLCRRVNQPPTSIIGSSAYETETEEITMAARKLGLIGDPRALPALARALRMPTVSAKAHAQIERSMWTLFGKSGDMELDLLLQKGRDIMHGKYMNRILEGRVEHEPTEEEIKEQIRDFEQERARSLSESIDIFTRIIEKSNGLFAEAWNQRATALYLRGDLASAYADAEEAFRLNPYHFGARSGMGLCKLGMRCYDEALMMFESTLEINPRIDSIKGQSKRLRKMMEKPRVEQQKLKDVLEDYKRSIAPSSDSSQRKDDDSETPKM
jgi:tetratricopeptide (TPR) repeat protein